MRSGGSVPTEGRDADEHENCGGGSGADAGQRFGLGAMEAVPADLDGHPPEAGEEEHESGDPERTRESGGHWNGG